MTIFKNKKALLCIMLTFIIFVSLLSCFAFTTKAATVTVGSFKVTGGTNGTDYSFSGSTLTIKKRQHSLLKTQILAQLQQTKLW